MRGCTLHNTMKIMRTAPSLDITPSFCHYLFPFLSSALSFPHLPLLLLIPPFYYSLLYTSSSLFSYSHQRSLLPEMPARLQPLLLSCSCVEELRAAAAASLRWPPLPLPPPSALSLLSWESPSAAPQLGSASDLPVHKEGSAEC